MLSYWKRILHTMLIAIVFLFLTGCEQAVYNNLSEQDANDVLLTLLKGGIEAEKRAGEKGYSIHVDGSKIAAAIGLLSSTGQPAQHYANLGEIFSRNGLISSPTEERVRFIYGVEQEIAKTLSNIDGVLVARVHIVLPANDPLSTQSKLSSASVFLKYRADMNMQVVVPDVKDLVVRSVEGLTADKVAVTMFPARATLTAPDQVPITRFFGALVASSSMTTLWILLGIPWALVIVLVLLLLNAVHIREWLKALLRARRRASEVAVADQDDIDIVRSQGQRKARL